MLRAEFKDLIVSASDHELYQMLKSILSSQFLGLSYSQWKLESLAEECYQRGKDSLYTSAMEDAAYLADKFKIGYSSLFVDEIFRPELMSPEETREILANTSGKSDSIESRIGIAPDQLFICKVTGESMIEENIHNGDVLIVDRTEKAADGRVIVAELDKVLFVKRLRIIDGDRWLYSGNPNFSPVKIEKDMDLNVIGVVKMTLHSVN